jgi:hypothetical protein
MPPQKISWRCTEPLQKWYWRFSKLTEPWCLQNVTIWFEGCCKKSRLLLMTNSNWRSPLYSGWSSGFDWFRDVNIAIFSYHVNAANVFCIKRMSFNFRIPMKIFLKSSTHTCVFVEEERPKGSHTISHTNYWHEIKSRQKKTARSLFLPNVDLTRRMRWQIFRHRLQWCWDLRVSICVLDSYTGKIQPWKYPACRGISRTSLLLECWINPRGIILLGYIVGPQDHPYICHKRRRSLIIYSISILMSAYTRHAPSL